MRLRAPLVPPMNKVRADSSPAPSEVSVRLQLVASYFLCSGLLALGMALYQGGHLALGASQHTEVDWRMISESLLLGVFGSLWLAAGLALLRRRRLGIVLAIVALLVLVTRMPFTGTRAVIETVFLTLAMVAVVSSWSEMRP